MRTKRAGAIIAVTISSVLTGGCSPISTDSPTTAFSREGVFDCTGLYTASTAEDLSRMGLSIPSESYEYVLSLPSDDPEQRCPIIVDAQYNHLEVLTGTESSSRGTIPVESDFSNWREYFEFRADPNATLRMAEGQQSYRIEHCEKERGCITVVSYDGGAASWSLSSGESVPTMKQRALSLANIIDAEENISR